MPPCRLRRRKFRKFDYEKVHSEVYLNKYVVSIAPFSKHACPDCCQNIQIIALFVPGDITRARYTNEYKEEV